MAKAQLHELLPVENALSGQAKKIIEEANTTFTKRNDLFQGWVKTYTPFDNAAMATESKTEQQELTTTVRKKLSYVLNTVGEFVDAKWQRESTNMTASADVVLEDGTVIISRAPVTFLLGLENILKQWREMILNVGTLASGISWVKDTDKGIDVYKTAIPQDTFRTRKELRYQVLVPATDKHPAQVEKWHEDVNCGKFTTTQWSGLITPAEKSELLARMDKLIAAAVKAKQRANQAEVVTTKVAAGLINYVMGE